MFSHSHFLESVSKLVGDLGKMQAGGIRSWDRSGRTERQNASLGRHWLDLGDELSVWLAEPERHWDWLEPDAPWTNNPTEQVIGEMKMRARTVRG